MKSLRSGRIKCGIVCWWIGGDDLWTAGYDFTMNYVVKLTMIVGSNSCNNNVWERIGEKHLAQLVGEGACQPDIFTKYRLGCELSYGSCPISLCALSA